MLHIGRIEYANCTPMFHALRAHFPCDDYTFTEGVPSYLNSLLFAGRIDVCPSSSFEYALHPERYCILPNLSISSVGPVLSVMLFSRLPIEDLHGQNVLLSADSATSVNLLKILMTKRFGCDCSYGVSAQSLDDGLKEAPAMLLIGDAALRAVCRNPDVYRYDLGSLWHEWTGLPFVFALWLCTREAVETKAGALRLLAERLKQCKLTAAAERDLIAAISPDAEWMGTQRLISYWRDNISYDLSAQHRAGLRHFFQLSAELGLLPTAPRLNMFGREDEGA